MDQFFWIRQQHDTDTVLLVIWNPHHSCKVVRVEVFRKCIGIQSTPTDLSFLLRDVHALIHCSGMVMSLCCFMVHPKRLHNADDPCETFLQNPHSWCCLCHRPFLVALLLWNDCVTHDFGCAACCKTQACTFSCPCQGLMQTT